MKINLNTLLTILSFIVIATVSHMGLKGDIRVLGTTEKLHHEYVMKELEDLKLAVADGVPIYLAEEKPIVKKRKAYAGTGDSFIYEEN